MNPKPSISSISPNECEANSVSFALTVNGSNFVASSLVYWNGSPLATVVVSQTQMTATVAPANIPVGAVYNVQVYTPETAPEDYDGGLSNIIEFQAILSVADAREYMIDRVDAHRNSLITGFFTFAGTQWDADADDTRNLMGINLLSVLNGGNLPPGTMWRDRYNNNFPATAMFMGGMAASFLTFGVINYNVSWVHKANIRALTDTAAVMNYDYTTGWPDPMVQH